MRSVLVVFLLLLGCSGQSFGQYDSTQNGRYKQYNDSQVLLFTGKYKDGLRHGIFKEYDAEGFMITKAHYRRGQLRWMQLYKNGKMYAVVNRKGEVRKAKDCGC